MEKKFFRLVTNAYDNVGGLLYAPKGVYRLAVDGEPVKNWENIKQLGTQVFILKFRF